ncbi:MAG TPA: hypothetical protein VMP01_25505, partial [Pirellulaceae bacterium]|nr:hypothetical protein [Pirellulaceae bacterium]
MVPDNDPPTPSDFTGSGFDSPPIDSELPDRWPESPASTEPVPAAETKSDTVQPASPFSTEPAPRRLAYLAAFRYVFESPDWFVSVVLLAVIGFLPVLGHVAQWGFYYEIVEALHRRPDAPYPKFDLRRFGDYCMRGVWPYVLSMMVGLMLYLIFYLPTQLGLQFGLMFLFAANQQVAIVVAAVVVSIVLVGALFVIVGTTVLTAPMLLRAGLAQDFRLVLRFDWIKGYLRRMWVEEVLATLFLLAAMALTPLGCVVFGVGFFAAQVIVWIAASHLQWQIYEIYLERGGEPIPLHPLPAEVPPV